MQVWSFAERFQKIGGRIRSADPDTCTIVRLGSTHNRFFRLFRQHLFKSQLDFPKVWTNASKFVSRNFREKLVFLHDCQAGSVMKGSNLIRRGSRRPSPESAG
jgi:hypothetical protein